MSRNIIVYAGMFLYTIASFGFHDLSWDQTSQEKVPVLVDDIVADIEFNQKDPRRPIVHYADIAKADPLASCPLDTFPADLKKVVNELVLKLRESTQKIKDIRSTSCGVLQDRIKSTETQVGDALKYQFAAGAPIPTAANQNIINDYTRRAAAVNQLVSLTNDMFKSGCISEARDITVIQKLVGQALTISGLFAGGWEGIGIATFGQIFANLPLHLDQLENTIRDIKMYDEKSESVTFLCWFRQILQVSGLMFATNRDSIINGLDLTFETGPARTTLESIEDIKSESPLLFNDVEMIEKVVSSSIDLLEALQSKNNVTEDPFSLMRKTKLWCEDNQPQNPVDGVMFAPDAHPKAIESAFLSLRAMCDELNQFAWPEEGELKNYLNKLNRAFFTLSEYYRTLTKGGNSVAVKIAGTLESMKFFEKTRKMMAQYKDTSIGNQFRVNFRELTEQMGSHYASRSFKETMKNNVRRFKAGGSDRRRSLKAMISVCQTFDPTLTKFGVDNYGDNKLMKLWYQKCVGPYSDLCDSVSSRKDEEQMLEVLSPSDRPFKVYFYSLCGHWKPVTPNNPF